jgi:hypothetical protein
VYAHCRAELGNLYGQARLAGMRFHLAALRQDVAVTAETPLGLGPEETGKLYREGERDGLAGPDWGTAPPDVCVPAVRER